MKTKEQLLQRLSIAESCIKNDNDDYEFYLGEAFNDNYYGEATLYFGKKSCRRITLD